MTIPAPILAYAFKLWDKCPWFIKWPFIVIIGPNLTVNLLVFFMIGIPWVDNRIQAHIIPRAERRDLMRQMDNEKQMLINNNTNETLKQILQNQSMMYSELIRRGSSQD